MIVFRHFRNKTRFVIAGLVACSMLLLLGHRRFHAKFDIPGISVLDSVSGRVCTLGWNDFIRPCSVKIALMIPWQRSHDFYRADVDYGSVDPELAPTVCEAMKIIHVGDRGTTVALSNEHNYYFSGPIDSPKSPASIAWAKLAVNGSLNLCGTQRLRTTFEFDGQEIETLRLW